MSVLSQTLSCPPVVLDDVLEVVLTSNLVASSVRTACTESLGKTSACSTLWSRPSLKWGAQTEIEIFYILDSNEIF